MFSGLLKMLPTFRKDNVKDTEIQEYKVSYNGRG